MFRQEIVAFKTYDTTGQNSHAINNITINYSDSMPDSHKQVDSAVKVHRGQVMRKMGAASVVDLARMADRLGLDGDLRDPASPAATRRVAP